MKKTSIFARIRSTIARHKIKSSVIVIIAILGGYWWYHTANSASTVPQYVLTRARTGTITQTVTGTGQVSASNQQDVKSQVSGAIETINVSVGDHVKKGDLLATIDSSSAYISLQNAKLSLAKLTEPAKPGDLLNAQNNLQKAYNDAFTATANIYIDMPNIMAGMKDLFYSQNGFLSNQKSASLVTSAGVFRNSAGQSFDTLTAQYNNAATEYKGFSRASATSSLDSLFADTYAMIKSAAETLKNTQNTIAYITSTQPDYFTSSASSASSNIVTWSNQVNSDLGSLVSAQNSIQSSLNTLNNLVTGTDALDIQSSKLSLQQQEQSYANYFIRAPFDGIVGRIPVNQYDQASGGTVIATIVGQQKIATISLNEIDAAKVQTGQLATITFDAIDGLTATGTVSQVDLVGTVTQGVVTYNVKILVNSNDQRIKAGMSVNTTIITSQKSGIMIVPTSAIKTLGKISYVNIFDKLPTSAASSTSISNRNGFGSTTGRFNEQFASTTSTDSSVNSNSSVYYRRNASTTYNGSFAGSGSNTNGTNNSQGQNRTTTITSTTAPRQQTVTTGVSDDTNTEITNGLNGGEWIVTKTITTGTAATTAAPSILSSLGGNRGTTGGAATRVTGR